MIFDMARESPWGEKLKGHREARGLTQRALANRAGVARNTINRLEMGIRRPSFGMLDRIARALRMSVSDLLR